MDIIYISDLRIETVIGAFDWERQLKQTVILDLELASDVRRAAATDRLADALDYKAVTKRVISYVTDNHFHLVETLAERVAQVLIDEFAVPWLRLRVNKQGALRGVRDVGVVIERGKR